MTKHEQPTSQAPQTEIAPEAQLSNEFLTGSRMTGIVPLEDGTHAVHAVSEDGMKYTRIHGNSNMSYAERHARTVAEADRYEDAVGVRPAGAPPRAEVVAPTGKLQKARKAARAILNNIKGKYPS